MAMTEADWLSCLDPDVMLAQLKGSRKRESVSSTAASGVLAVPR
jgi:hypothetical protein